LGPWAAGHGTRRDAGPGRGLQGGHNRDPFGHREAAAAMPVLQALNAGAQSAGAGSGAVGLGQSRKFGPMARGEGRAHDRKTSTRNLQMVEFAGDEREDKESGQQVTYSRN